MRRIKKFNEFFQPSILEKDDDMDLLRDLENIGMKDRTYTVDMLRDALNDVNFDAYLSTDIAGDDFEMTFKQQDSDSGEVLTNYVGGISVEFDKEELWSDIVNSVNSLNMEDYEDDLDEDRYTIEDLESAFDSVDWDDIGQDAAEELYGDIEVDVDGRDEGEGTYYVSAEATIDSDAAEVADEDIINRILDNL